ncbi:hypothetical protein [Mariniblastus fucicola]|uniref:Pseudopilin GspJ n=1 Tax=Mariniblastus fucicola TaxID=980251 RepID=A0A5B9PII6_9BACT|nr:hypothetical protein [Mariniblastus fucicola]QEG22443.1 Pseudopilin GspJ [Mariniblastus fucicola]
MLLGKEIRIRRDGYNLLELILAMALMVVVMSGIASAINAYMVQVAKQQARVERELVARNSLTMMANDIRSAIQYKATDYGGLNVLLETYAMMDGVIEEREEEDQIFDEEEVSFRPTMLGTSNAIMLDISRLPRLDQYNPLLEKTSERESTVSDIKSISYFFSAEKGGYDPKISRRENEITGGMYRREIDRAVANFRGDETLQVMPDDFAELVASEVAEINFKYFDGNDWTDSWDSEEEGGFPTAIEITLIIDPRRTSSASTGYQYNGFDRTVMTQERLTVFLPMAEPALEEEE